MKKMILLCAIAALGFSTVAKATLLDRGNGMIYDNVLNITWLQDANYARTSGYDADGRMTWNNAMAWASNLVFGGYDDWRLASITDTGIFGCNSANTGTDCGYNVNTTTSELAYMYHVNLGLESLINADGSYNPTWGVFGNGTGGGQNDIGLINNLQSNIYWSGTEYVASITNMAWYFYTFYGSQYYGSKNYEFYAWAVRDGDVQTPVPEPETYAMLLAGLGLLSFTAQRRKQSACLG